ncbi:MAG: hypothetical protein V3S37_02880 [Dehalococcoidia bacterium]
MEEVAISEEHVEQTTATESSLVDGELAAGTGDDQSLEQPVVSTVELEATLDEVRTTLAERETELQEVQRQLTSAIALYREALLAAAPEVPEEMVTGTTPEELGASLARARQVVERIRSHIESQLAEQRVPTGAPIRSGVDLTSLSPQDKIAYGLIQRERGR